jgi:hypothetical protein
MSIEAACISIYIVVLVYLSLGFVLFCVIVRFFLKRRGMPGKDAERANGSVALNYRGHIPPRKMPRPRGFE